MKIDASIGAAGCSRWAGDAALARTVEAELVVCTGVVAFSAMLGVGLEIFATSHTRRLRTRARFRGEAAVFGGSFCGHFERCFAVGFGGGFLLTFGLWGWAALDKERERNRKKRKQKKSASDKPCGVHRHGLLRWQCYVAKSRMFGWNEHLRSTRREYTTHAKDRGFFLGRCHGFGLRSPSIV